MLTTTLLTGLLLAGQAPAKKDEPSPEPPPPAPISARLVAKKKTYKLDLGGMTADKFRETVKPGGANLPAAPAVDLVLIITNNTKNDIRIRTTGATARLSLTLTGPNVVQATVTERRVVRQPISVVDLRPKQSVQIPIDRLVSTKSTVQTTRHYWTEAGEHTLAAEFSTVVYTEWMAAGDKDKVAVKGGPVMRGRATTLKARAIKVKVEK
jgi:hypothetical protein